MLIATCPHLYDTNKVEAVFSHPNISAVRYNTGAHSLSSIEHTLEFLKSFAIKYGKTLWIDIKGRQLRVAKWAEPTYECIELNHNITIEYPAKLYLRGDICGDIATVMNGNRIILTAPSRKSVGAGQSVNIIAKKLEIEGYLTDIDKQYLVACEKMNINNIMASYVEDVSDILVIKKYLPNAIIVSKIESLKGLNAIDTMQTYLMAAREDLYIEMGNSPDMLGALRKIINSDRSAICASRIFTSLEHSDVVQWNDYTDILLMHMLGYNNFMLCDNVCNYSFEQAMVAWDKIKGSI